MVEPTKTYFSISEVGKLIDEQQHVLRYWEREFPELRPKKNSAGNRIYTHKDLELLCVIKIMLRQKRLSVVDAKVQLKRIDVKTFLTEHPFTFSPIESNDDNVEKEGSSDGGAKSKTLTFQNVERDNDMVQIPRSELRTICELLKELEHLLRTV